MRNERLEKYESKPATEGAGRKAGRVQWVLMAGTLLVGMVIGKNMDNRLLEFKISGGRENPNKLVSIIDFIESYYVDSVQKRELIDDAIASILSNLDPHSYYISPEELAAMNEPLEGGFEGIGVEFIIRNDSLMVVKPIARGPSERAGILAGDRIIKVNGEPISGKDLNSDKAMKLLKGKKGTKVNVTILRNKSQVLDFELERGAIPIESVTAAFMVSDSIGYIKLARYAKTSYDEFMMAMARLQGEGAQSLILDLRGNGGGLMNAATDIIEEFLPEDKLIVYVEGVHTGRKSTVSRKKGKFRNMDLVLIIDQGSASASEIMAGALQDWDRCVTVGRRSFGKGLVQREIELGDRSALRLTVARYYTPLGRSIQRPYGDSIDYNNDFMKRLMHGELSSADSVHWPDSLRFTTRGGRVLYGGGGIMPDVFVPVDSLIYNTQLGHLAFSGFMRDFIFDYTDRNRNKLQSDFSDADEFYNRFEVSDEVLREYVRYALSDSVVVNEKALNAVKNEIKLRLKAQMARNLFDEQLLTRVMLSRDQDFSKALEVMKHYDQYNIIKK